jgi:hypothetical protein
MLFALEKQLDQAAYRMAPTNAPPWPTPVISAHGQAVLSRERLERGAEQTERRFHSIPGFTRSVESVRHHSDSRRLTGWRFSCEAPPPPGLAAPQPPPPGCYHARRGTRWLVSCNRLLGSGSPGFELMTAIGNGLAQRVKVAFLWEDLGAAFAGLHALDQLVPNLSALEIGSDIHELEDADELEEDHNPMVCLGPLLRPPETFGLGEGSLGGAGGEGDNSFFAEPTLATHPGTDGAPLKEELRRVLAHTPRRCLTDWRFSCAQQR